MAALYGAAKAAPFEVDLTGPEAAPFQVDPTGPEAAPFQVDPTGAEVTLFEVDPTAQKSHLSSLIQLMKDNYACEAATHV